MLREIFTDVTPNTRFRKIAAIVLYVFFMLCIIYSNNRKAGSSDSVSKSMEAGVK
jgi:preprotein translocase subunit SecG